MNVRFTGDEGGGGAILHACIESISAEHLRIKISLKDEAVKICRALFLAFLILSLPHECKRRCIGLKKR